MSHTATFNELLYNASCPQSSISRIGSRNEGKGCFALVCYTNPVLLARNSIIICKSRHRTSNPRISLHPPPPHLRSLGDGRLLAYPVRTVWRGTPPAYIYLTVCGLER